MTEESKAEFLAISKELDDLLLKQEIFWAQRSRISWLKHGDKNNNFSTQKPHKEDIQTLYRESKLKATLGWKRLMTLRR